MLLILIKFIMLEALDAIDRSQDYLISLGFEIVNDNYKEFRQFIVEDNREEYDKFYQYLVNNYKFGSKKCGIDQYCCYEITKLRYHNYCMIMEYKYSCVFKTHHLLLKISNHNISLIIIDNEFRFIIKNVIRLGFYSYDDFKFFCENLKNVDSNHMLMMDNLVCINDILDKIDCEVINELEPMLYKMFMTIFSKPTMKSANSVTINE